MLLIGELELSRLLGCMRMAHVYHPYPQQTNATNASAFITRRNGTRGCAGATCFVEMATRAHTCPDPPPYLMHGTSCASKSCANAQDVGSKRAGDAFSLAVATMCVSRPRGQDRRDGARLPLLPQPRHEGVHGLGISKSIRGMATTGALLLHLRAHRSAHHGPAQTPRKASSPEGTQAEPDRVHPMLLADRHMEFGSPFIGNKSRRPRDCRRLPPMRPGSQCDNRHACAKW